MRWLLVDDDVRGWLLPALVSFSFLKEDDLESLPLGLRTNDDLAWRSSWCWCRCSFSGESTVCLVVAKEFGDFSLILETSPTSILDGEERDNLVQKSYACKVENKDQYIPNPDLQRFLNVPLPIFDLCAKAQKSVLAQILISIFMHFPKNY